MKCANSSQNSLDELKRIRAVETRALLEPKTQISIMIGTATCGQAAGALQTLRAIKEELYRLQVEANIVEVGCSGHCYAEPLVVIYKPGLPGICYGYVTEDVGARLVQDYVAGDDPCLEFALAALQSNELLPTFADYPRGQVEQKVALMNCGYIDPENLGHYLATGGYEALARALGYESVQIISDLKYSGLRGRGGAGFSTALKWETCLNTESDTKYVICNADEGDPGAFMDRTILESNPHLVLEGLAIAGYAVGASKGYFYVRSEYPLAVRRLELAVEQARQAGLLGRKILGSNFNFELEIFKGAGAFVCGEETALIASMEGEAGLPRPRPPFPASAGLWGKPTVINNVKTLAYVPYIINNGADWFRSTGSPGNPGTAVFALAGKVINNGLVEVPLGTTLRQVIFDAGSGLAGGKCFKAVQIGGPSGGCLPEALLDTPVDFDSLSNTGAIMGSGGMIVLSEDDCMVEMSRYFLDFIQRESCGKCTFCRLGAKHMHSLLEQITLGNGKPEDLELLINLAEDVKAGSLCGLGKTAPNPVLSAIKYFSDEFEAHIHEKRCPALRCKELITYHILPDKCERSCNACVGSCPVEAIFSNEDRIKVIDQQKCVKCEGCLVACPPQYKAVVKQSPPAPANAT